MPVTLLNIPQRTFSIAGDLEVSDDVTVGDSLEVGGTATTGGSAAFGTMTAGTGITTATGVEYEANVYREGSLIKTEIYIDLTGLNSNAAGDVIGKDGTANSHFGQLTAALNGNVYRGFVTCLETPATGEPDIDLFSADEATLAEDAAISSATDEVKLLDAGGDWTAGTSKAITALPDGDQYLYLVGSGDGTNQTYTAGIFFIELWGRPA